jgi:hypothetical protein
MKNLHHQQQAIVVVLIVVLYYDLLGQKLERSIYRQQWKDIEELSCGVMHQKHCIDIEEMQARSL